MEETEEKMLLRERRCCCGFIRFYHAIIAITILSITEGFWIAFVLIADHTVIQDNSESLATKTHSKPTVFLMVMLLIISVFHNYFWMTGQVGIAYVASAQTLLTVSNLILALTLNKIVGTILFIVHLYFLSIVYKFAK
jgi:hypothetical protein